MEYMENDSLYAYLKNNQATPFEASKKVDIALDIARGIDFLHRLKIIHRDLKMGNVLLDSQFNAKISDFGLSIIKENQISMIPLLEAGTSSYMAPETFGAGALYSSKSDVFAFGILLWGLIHWSQPFGGVQREEIRQLVWKERYRLPISAGVPRPISSVISCCWAQSPVHRPAMSEVKDFLEKVVMIEGLITQNEIFSHEMTTQATEMDRTEKLATPVHNFIAALPKPGLINSMSNLQEVGQKTANAGLKSSHQIQPSIAGSESNIEVHGLAQRRAPTIPIVNQPEALGDDLARKLTNAVPRTAPSVPQSIKQPPISYMSKPPPSAMIPQSMSEGIFKSKSMSHKHEDIPKKLWFGRRREVVIAIFVFSIFAIAALISVIVVVANMNFKAAQTSEGESTLSTTSPPPTPTCIIKNPKKVLSTGCKTRNANVSTFAGSFNNRGNFNGPRLNPALYVPYGLAFLPNGSLVISDYYGFNIITGNNLYSPPYLAGTGLAMRGFSVDSDGIMYVPVEGRYIAAVDTRTSVVTVFAGNTSTNGTKDSIDLLDAQFSYIVGTMLYEGLMYVVDRGLPGTRSSIRVIDYCPYSPTPGVKIFQASGLSQKSHSSAMDQEGNIYYSTDSHCISKFILANNTVLPCFAGTNNGVGVSDGPPGFGRFDTPKGLAFDSCGNLFVADTNNNLIRVVDKDGVISTVDTDISIQSPTSLAFSPGGNLYFSQQSYHIVRRAALW